MSGIVVRHQTAVECHADECGDVVFTREAHEWEGHERVAILIPRECVPGLIARLQALMAKGD
jgi:hypothetical protein